MKFYEIIEEQLSEDTSFVLNEGFLKINPAIAYFVFKDNVLSKIKSTKQAIKDKEISAKQELEKIKAKTIGKSEDTVYSYTKEQKEILAKLYKKYGAKIVNQIDEFRKNILAPYQVIKREVAKNYMKTDKTRFGMTKEEYYQYLESGRRKIEKKGTYFKDSKSMYREQDKAREALRIAKNAFENFKVNGSYDLSAANIEKIFDDAGLGLKELKGWTQNELATTLNEIERLQELLKHPEANGKYKISGSARTGSALYLTKDEIEYRITSLRERGISKVNQRSVNKNKNIYDYNDHNAKRPFGSFKNAMSIYLLRREKINEIRSLAPNSEFKRFYKDVLKDSLDTAKKIYETKFDNYMSMKKNITLNQYEAKIWKKKLLGNEYSGKIDDWELKIKPEDFKGVEYNEKSPKIIQAEKDFDKELKRFERELLKIMSPEDVATCKKYKLFNNLLTIKQLKDPSSMFKKAEKSKSESSNNPSDETGDLNELIDSITEKDYNSIKELKSAQERLSKLIKGKELDSGLKKQCDKFLEKLDPNGSKRENDLEKYNNKEISKSAPRYMADKAETKAELEKLIDSILNNAYSKTSATDELKNLDEKLENFKKFNNDESLKAMNYSLNKARDKLNMAIRG